MTIQICVDEGLSLPIPHDWRRSAAIAYSNGEEGDQGISVVVRRESLDARVTLGEYSDNALVELARTMPEFALVERRTCEIDQRPAMEIRYTLKVQGKDYYQRQLYVLDIPGSVLIISSTVLASEAENHAEFFDNLISGARLARPGSRPPESAR